MWTPAAETASLASAARFSPLAALPCLRDALLDL
jgi:hypothetical protein